MYKVEIYYDFVSPSLQVMTGRVNIGRINFGKLPQEEDSIFTFKKEKHSLGYQECSSIFTRAKPIVDIMIRSYFDGMLLSDESVTWFENAHRLNNQVTLVIPD